MSDFILLDGLIGLIPEGENWEEDRTETTWLSTFLLDESVLRCSSMELKNDYSPRQLLSTCNRKKMTSVCASS